MMSSRAILVIIILLIVVLLGAVFVVISANDPSSCINSRRGSDGISNEHDLIVGAWLEPVPGNENEMQGFLLRQDGTAASINMETLRYTKWYIDGDDLVLTVESLGNGVSFTDEQRFGIDTVTEDTLRLKNVDLVMEFTRGNADEVTVTEGSLTPGLKKVTSEEVAYYGNVTGYLARPDDGGIYPGLILIHEWWGLNDNIRGLAEQFAAQGYVALAVDLYGGEAAATPEEAGALAGGVRENVDEAFNNLTSAVSYLGTLESVDDEHLASVGWCFGGGWAYEMAKNDLGIDASVMYYGRFSHEDDLSMMRADILGHFGEEDASIAVDDVREFEAKLDTLNGDHAVFIYPNAGHAFANEDNEDAYNAEAAELAWSRTMEFLARELEKSTTGTANTDATTEESETTEETEAVDGDGGDTAASSTEEAAETQ